MGRSLAAEHLRYIAARIEFIEPLLQELGRDASFDDLQIILMMDSSTSTVARPRSRLSWVDVESGEIILTLLLPSRRRKTPGVGQNYSAFPCAVEST